MRPIIHFGAALHDSKYTRFIVPWWKVSHTWKHDVLYFSLNINIASNIFSVTSWSPYAERVDILHVILSNPEAKISNRNKLHISIHFDVYVLFHRDGIKYQDSISTIENLFSITI